MPPFFIRISNAVYSTSFGKRRKRVRGGRLSEDRDFLHDLERLQTVIEIS